MARVLSLSSRGGSLELGEAAGVVAGMKVRGFGMPGVSLQWFEGAGEGATLRGGRTLARTIDMPVKVYGDDRREVLDRFSSLARILLQENAPVRLTLELDGEAWYTEGARTGGGDPTWGDDTANGTYLRSVFTMQFGDPFMTRVNSEARVIEPSGLGIPLIGPGQSLAQLRMSNTEGTGSVQFQNTGDTRAWPTWRVLPPFQAILLERDGLALQWSQPTLKTAGWLDINSKDGTVKDETGANRYDGLAPAPKFFPVQPGTSRAQVVLSGATADTRVNVAWHPRKAVLF